MTVTLGNLRNVLEGNVAEIKFQRRKAKPGFPLERRMLCTHSYNLLNSAKGRTALNFKPTSNSPGYNPTGKNLILTWDIFMQDYRAINMDRCELISVIPANEEFWQYYTQKLKELSPQEKLAFMSI